MTQSKHVLENRRNFQFEKILQASPWEKPLTFQLGFLLKDKPTHEQINKRHSSFLSQAAHAP